VAENGKTYVVENGHIYTLNMNFLHHRMGEYVVWDVIRRFRESEQSPHANIPSAVGHIFLNGEGVARLPALRMIRHRIKITVGLFIEVLL
jgi:hypothetical protein